MEDWCGLAFWGHSVQASKLLYLGKVSNAQRPGATVGVPIRGSFPASTGTKGSAPGLGGCGWVGCSCHHGH